MSDLLQRLRVALHGTYDVERELGAGGMAHVFVARDLKHDRAVAIKVLKPEIAAAIGVDRFLREIQIAAKLNHPRILPLHDSGVADGFLYYVMPYVEGESLRDRLERERQLSVSDAIVLTRQIAAGLSYAHSHGIVHRDIKPENILLHGGEAVIADFGIARAVAAAGSAKLTETGVAVGTPMYMSPEQAAADDQSDSRSDIYSLGCVLYEMLTGHPPFTGSTAHELIARHALDPVPPVRTMRGTVPTPVEQVVLRSLAKTPADRFATAQQFAECLELATSFAEPPAGRRWSRVAVWTAGACFVLAGAWGLWALWHRAPLGNAAAASGGVAVLYFDNESPDSADAYLADGLTEEIITRLGDVPRLTVASRYAVRQYRGKPVVDLQAVGRNLHVASIVNGSVRRSGHHLRVLVELDRAATGKRVWGSTYDRADTDMLAIEGDIAQTVARALAGRLAPEERAALAHTPTTNPTAYDDFLRGDYFLAKRTAPATSTAMSEYEAAVALDSAFSRAWARDAVGYALYLAWEWTYPGLPRDSLLARGVDAANRALAEDSASSDAWMAEGMFQWFLHPSDWGEALPMHERAVALDPANAEAHNMLGITQFYEGMDSAAAVSFHAALALDPRRPITLARLAELEWFHGHRDAATRYIDSALAMAPAFVLAVIDRAEMRLGTGDLGGARQDAQTALRLSSGSSPAATSLLVAIDARSGDSTAARARERGLEARLGQTVGLPSNAATAMALARLSIGDREGAVYTLLHAQDQGPLLRWNLRWPEFDPIRTDPRIQRLIASINASVAANMDRGGRY